MEGSNPLGFKTLIVTLQFVVRAPNEIEEEHVEYHVREGYFELGEMAEHRDLSDGICFVNDHMVRPETVTVLNMENYHA